MGQDKAMLPVDGQAMALCLAQKYAVLGQVAFSVDRAGRFPTGGYPELPDSYPGRGPLNGIVSAFRQTGAEVIFLTATDMPGGSPAAARALLNGLGEYDACMYGQEPLLAVYRRSCLEPAVSCLERGEYSFRGFLREIRVNRLPRGEEALFLNLNTPEEYGAFINRQK